MGIQTVEKKGTSSMGSPGAPMGNRSTATQLSMVMDMRERVGQACKQIEALTMSITGQPCEYPPSPDEGDDMRSQLDNLNWRLDMLFVNLNRIDTDVRG